MTLRVILSENLFLGLLKSLQRWLHPSPLWTSLALFRLSTLSTVLRDLLLLLNLLSLVLVVCLFYGWILSLRVDRSTILLVHIWVIVLYEWLIMYLIEVCMNWISYITLVRIGRQAAIVSRSLQLRKYCLLLARIVNRWSWSTCAGIFLDQNTCRFLYSITIHFQKAFRSLSSMITCSAASNIPIHFSIRVLLVIQGLFLLADLLLWQTFLIYVLGHIVTQIVNLAFF